MYEFIKVRYQMGKISSVTAHKWANKFLTSEESERLFTEIEEDRDAVQS